MPQISASTPGRPRRRVPKVYPASVADPLLIGPLADLRDAMDLTQLWKAIVALLDAALPNFHYVAALPCVEDRPVFVSTTIPMQDEPGYWERFISCEPPLSRVLREAPLAKISYLDDHWPEDELRQTAFYEKIMAPEGWWHAAGFLFWERENFVGHIGMNRTVEQGPYLPHERELLEAIYPQAEAAVRRIAAFDRERSKRAALEEVLKQAPDGIVILDWELRPIFQNRAAAEACQRWNEDAGKTVDELPEEVKEAAGKLLAGSEILLRQPPPGRVSAPASELFHQETGGLRARLRLLHPREKQAIKPHCLIEFSRVIDRPGNEPAIPAFALSTAERRVAHLVAQGQANASIAAELSLSIHTVRAHLREIFAKLGIKHRGELAAVLARADGG